MEIQTILIAILLYLLFVNPSFITTDKALIERTCKKTHNPEDCIASLESDRRSSAAADVTGLAKISLELISSKVNKTYAQVFNLVNNASDYQLWAVYTVCYDYYKDIVANVISSLQSFHKKKYNLTYKKLDDVNSAGTECSKMNIPTIISINQEVIQFTNDTLTILHLLF